MQADKFVENVIHVLYVLGYTVLVPHLSGFIWYTVFGRRQPLNAESQSAKVPNQLSPNGELLKTQQFMNFAKWNMQHAHVQCSCKSNFGRIEEINAFSLSFFLSFSHLFFFVQFLIVTKMYNVKCFHQSNSGTNCLMQMLAEDCKENEMKQTTNTKIESKSSMMKMVQKKKWKK